MPRNRHLLCFAFSYIHHTRQMAFHGRPSRPGSPVCKPCMRLTEALEDQITDWCVTVGSGRIMLAKEVEYRFALQDNRALLQCCITSGTCEWGYDVMWTNTWSGNCCIV
jgi:hypothetical protein